MQIKVNNKLIMIFLLLCFLFLTSSISILDANGLISSPFSSSGISTVIGTSGSSSSMSGGMDLTTHEYMSAAYTYTVSSSSSINQSRILSLKTNFAILLFILTVQLTTMAAYLKFSKQTYTKLFSGFITIILHKKDGMK